MFALLTVWFILSARCGNYSNLPTDIQTNVFWKLSVMDRLNVRKVDKERNELVMAVHRADVYYVNEMKMFVANVTDENIFCRPWYLERVEMLVQHRMHTIPFHQALPSILRIIKQNDYLSQKNKKILTAAVNVTHGKCQLCFEDTNVVGLIHCINFFSQPENICNFCKQCWKHWTSKNKQGLILCPVCCEGMAFRSNDPFAQPGYVANETQSCFDRMQNRIDIRNGCVGNFVCLYWSFASWIWCSRIDAGFHGICDYAECCLRAVVAVPVTVGMIGGVIECLSITACCCCDCCYVCLPENNWRAGWLQFCTITARCVRLKWQS